MADQMRGRCEWRQVLGYLGDRRVGHAQQDRLGVLNRRRMRC